MSRTRALAFVITCEHAGNRIPARYQACFAGQDALLASHEAYDRGALQMARDFARRFEAPLFHSTTSRLLVDLNRSPGHRRIHAPAVRALSAQTRREICAVYYHPMRSQAEQAIAAAIADGKQVVHVSSHSFTPVLDGQVRTADVGLLYDPRRRGEVALCAQWQAQLAAQRPGLRVRRNYPYTGKSDGFAAFLRRQHGAARYVGVELEINQAIVQRGGRGWAQLRQAVLASFAAALASLA